MSKAHTFKAKVKCDQGWPFDGAFVAIYDWSQSLQETGTSSNCEDEESIESSIEVIAYSGVFWQNIQAQVDKLAPRPLVDLANTENPHLLTVAKKNRLIELDVARRYA